MRAGSVGLADNRFRLVAIGRAAKITVLIDASGIQQRLAFGLHAAHLANDAAGLALVQHGERARCWRALG